MAKQLLYIDFETYWESKKGGYGLRQLSMVEYIRDPRFKAFGMGVAVNDQPIEWISGSQISNFCSDVANGIGWPNITLVGHNLKFDASILRHVYDCVPGEFRDTKAMSKGVLGKSVKSHSLMDLALYFGLIPKGTMKTDGLRELTKEQEAELAEYCLHDVRLCREIYKRLAKDFPENQYPYVNWTIESFVSPKLELNTKLLEDTNEKEKERRANIFTEIGIEKSIFASNKRFFDLLKGKGYEAPTKISSRTGKTIPALALGDTEFIELSENGNEELKKLCEARIAAKSTLLETRSLKLANISKTGLWPFDIEYSGADQTHRFSGGSGAGGNPQNFTRGSALRDAVQAPEGHSLVVGDFSNIELRLVAYLSKDPGLIGAIERGSDIYCDFASAFYKRKITKENVVERQFGKCLAEGTLVITDSGCKRIEEITIKDKLWDGSEFVSHTGVIDNGTKETISFDRLWLTPDHLILCGTRWLDALLVERDENARFLALDRASVKLSSLDTSKGKEAELLASFESAIADHRNKWLTSQILSLEEQRAVTIALKKPEQKNDTGNTQPQWPTMPIEPDYSIVYRQLSRDVTIQKIGTISITENEEYGFMTVGVPTNQSFCALFRLFRDGTSQLLKWIEPTSTADMYRATYALCLDQKTYLTNAESKTSKRVYDILNAGSQNRFTVLTAEGPIIVHNCAILGLGYGMGAKKFAKTVKIKTGHAIPQEEAQAAVDLYRTLYSRVPATWEKLHNTIPRLTVDHWGKLLDMPVMTGKECILLPSGLRIKFMNLRQEDKEWTFDVYSKKNLEQRRLYGGKLLENLCQALAGEICKTAMVVMDEQVVGQCHDELLVLCKKGLELSTVSKLKRAMSIAPSWLPQIKLEAEVSYGKSWGECK